MRPNVAVLFYTKLRQHSCCVRGHEEGLRPQHKENKIAPLISASGDTITDRGKQMGIWAEHYQEVYSRENIVTDVAVKLSRTPGPCP